MIFHSYVAVYQRVTLLGSLMKVRCRIHEVKVRHTCATCRTVWKIIAQERIKHDNGRLQFSVKILSLDNYVHIYTHYIYICIQIYLYCILFWNSRNKGIFRGEESSAVVAIHAFARKEKMGSRCASCEYGIVWKLRIEGKAHKSNVVSNYHHCPHSKKTTYSKRQTHLNEGKRLRDCWISPTIERVRTVVGSCRNMSG